MNKINELLNDLIIVIFRKIKSKNQNKYFFIFNMGLSQKLNCTKILRILFKHFSWLNMT